MLLVNDVVSQLPSCVPVMVKNVDSFPLWEAGLCLDFNFELWEDVACSARVMSSCERLSYRTFTHQAVLPPGCAEALCLSRRGEG